MAFPKPMEPNRNDHEDGFDAEVELLRNNPEFMKLMKKLSRLKAAISLQDLRNELELSSVQQIKKSNETLNVRRVATSWKLIEDVLKEHVHSAFERLRPPATTAQIDRLKAEFPRRLPRAFEQSLRIHDGIAEAKSLVNYMTLLPVSKITSVWRMEWDLQCECQFPGCERTKTRKLENDARWREGWLPFMDFNGDKLVLDLEPGPAGKVGQVFKWYNYPGRPNYVIADSIEVWFDMLAGELSRRRFTLNEYGDILLKKQSLT